MSEKTWRDIINAIVKIHGMSVFLLGITFITLFLLFSPENLLETLFGIHKFTGNIRQLLAFCLIFSVFMLCAIFLSSNCKIFIKCLQTCKTKIIKTRIAWHLKRLTLGEQEIIKKFLKSGTELEHLPLNPHVISLQRKAIINRPLGFSHAHDRFPFFLDDMVREIIFANKHISDENLYK